MRRMLPALALMLASCATYHPMPLAPAPDVLQPPVAAVLERAADHIARPWLTPVRLDLAAPLTPDGIATLAVVNNPDLKAARVRAGVADAQVFAAGLLPDPTVSVGGNKVLTGPDPFLDLASSLALDINALRTRGVTREAARAQARQVRLDLAWQEWQTAGLARIQAIRIQSFERQVALAQQSLAAARSLLGRTERAAGRGDLAGTQLETARVADLDAVGKLRTAQSSLASARSELSRLLGLPPGMVPQLAATPLPAPPPGTDALFALARANRTDLGALRAGYAAQEATVHKAVLDQFPTLDLTINANRDSAGNALLGPAVGFTLPLWNRNRGGIAVERATRAALRAEYDARLFATRADIGAAEAGLTVAYRQRADALQSLTTVRRYAEATQRAAARGDLSGQTAISAEQTLRDREMQIAVSDEAIREQMVALELLTGTPREAWTP